jgi:uncharacterized membrane protein YsdA (DUF1294 family)
MGYEVKAAIYLLLLVNITAFIMVGIDKYKARRKAWRIPERVFFWFALIGGCIGVYSGLLTFRHKTRHWYFMFGIPGIFFLQSMIFYYIYCI